MDLSAYLDRIGFTGPATPDHATLAAVQRGHHLSIPYENLDVQLGRPSTTDPAAAFEKLVSRRRGGWCYEMNGTMGMALEMIGFKVTRLTGAVMRSAAGDSVIGNHLVLRIDLPEGPILADVGVGDGPFEPFELIEGRHSARGVGFRIERVDGGWWRIHNHDLCRPPNFDVHPELTGEDVLAGKCAFLQTDPASMFVQTLICQRFTPTGHVDLMGKVLREIGPRGVAESTLASADELVVVLKDVFGLDEPEAATLWPKICARHDLVFGVS